MDGFDHILNWKLKQGSHTFPGKDGGTCINEAAVVAVGFEYRPIRSVEDMPGKQGDLASASFGRSRSGLQEPVSLA